MTTSIASTKTLERKLKQIQKEEALVNKYLNWLTLFLALLYWVLDGRRLDTTARSKGGKPNRSSVSTSSMGWIGGAIAVSKLGVRWYYMRRKRELEIELLEREPTRKARDVKKGKKTKRKGRDSSL